MVLIAIGVIRVRRTQGVASIRKWLAKGKVFRHSLTLAAEMRYEGVVVPVVWPTQKVQHCTVEQLLNSCLVGR